VKRLSATTLAALLCVGGLSACGGDEAAVEVDGETVLTVDELEIQLDELADAPDALTALDGRGSGESLSAGFVSSVLDNHVLLAVIDDVLAEDGLEPADVDVEGGTRILTDTLGSGEIPLALEDVPESYRQTLVDVFTGYAALIVGRGGNLEDPNDPTNQTVLAGISEDLLAARQEIDVAIAARFGRWDTSGDRPAVAPPEGPVTVETTIPLAIPGG
jgi:hypothetical protein